MSFPALLDTNVLYGALLNDFFLELADRGLYRPLWSADILEELRRNLIRAGEDEHLVDKRISTMVDDFPDAMVEGCESLIPTMTCDPKDRHVLAAADFLLDQLDLYHAPTLRALVELVDGYNSPAMTIDDYLLVLTRAGVPRFADAARDLLY